ncbi:Selenoprotein Pb [Dufourea novaeangliae]|uniref:Selenoprotein Pb n=1 Tax=Dufourea novaeangliae TaxID=178035 RepID=A0A154PDX3_DUFNO|nr:Selenoprotein Pb [Dufourea novaeangliae]
MLDLLKKRLERSGFTDIVFFIVIPSSNLPENTMENNVEIKTWKRISMNMVEPEYILGTDETQFNDLARNSKKDILCVQDTPDLGIWERFRASKDEVVVVDRCGRLTYQVIIPWSILYFPYVKAAILSTYKENPCGPCDVKKTFDSYTEGTPHNFESESVTVLSEKSKENDKYTTTVAPIDVNLSTNETTTSDVTITDTPLITADHIYDTTPVEDIRQDNNMTDNATFTDDKIETTTEISLEHGQTVTLSTISEVSYKATEEYNETQDIDPFKAQMNTRTKVTKNEKLPLRIILYAPHIHKENETLKQYTHLILQAGNPGYHDHFNYMSAVDEQKEPMISENSDPTTVGNKMSEGFISGINESPGVYGEIADYWRTEDDEFNNQNENIAYFEPDDVTIDDVESKIDNNESHTLAQSVDVNADADIKINVSSEDSDEFVQRRLIEHYRKLLSWIYYSL